MSYEPTVMRRALARLERRREERERRRYVLERGLRTRCLFCTADAAAE